MAGKLNKIHAALKTLAANPDLLLSDFALPRADDQDIFRIAKEKTGIDWHNTLYDELEQFAFKWTSKSCEDPDVMGSVKILPLKKVIEDWNLGDGAMKDFFILDYFTNEICVGFYKGLDYLYLYEMGGETKYLSLDFNGYLEVCLAAEGFLYWPVIVRGFIDDQVVPEAERFDKYMPGIFEGASVAKVREVYERVKIKGK
jgi:hypothetical protein